jgi:hypothetical protein
MAGLSAADVRASRALASACAHGHLTLAEWLVKTFSLSIDDVRADGNFALNSASYEGELAVVVWLVETVGLTADDATEAKAVSIARARGYGAVADWLTKQLGVTA